MSGRQGPKTHLLLCDACCDHSGVLKEMIKTGGCTCDICGWSCKCSRDDDKQFVNSVDPRHISEAGWAYLQEKNARNLLPIDWVKLFTGEQ